MRRAAPTLTLLLALSVGPVAQAQDFDPDQVECLALSYIALSQAENDLPTATDNRVADLVDLLGSVSAGISHIVAEGSGCTGTVDDMIAVVQTARNDIVARFQTRVADTGDAAAAYVDVIFAPLQLCSNEIGQDRIEAANADRLANGYACGWGQ